MYHYEKEIIMLNLFYRFEPISSAPPSSFKVSGKLLQHTKEIQKPKPEREWCNIEPQKFGTNPNGDLKGCKIG